VQDNVRVLFNEIKSGMRIIEDIILSLVYIEFSQNKINERQNEGRYKMSNYFDKLRKIKSRKINFNAQLVKNSRVSLRGRLFAFIVIKYVHV